MQQRFVLANENLRFEVEPAVFHISALDKGTRYTVSAALPEEKVEIRSASETQLSFFNPGRGIDVTIILQNDHLDVNIRAAAVSDFTWPVIPPGAEAFTVPFHQGKYIPAKDPEWLKHLTGNGPFSGLEALSMQFFAVNYTQKAIVYILTNPFNNELAFTARNGAMGLRFTHEFTGTVPVKEYGFRIYLSGNDPVSITKWYKKYVAATTGIVTLEEKAKTIPAIRQLYGAPHIYVWNDHLIAANDIVNWKQFRDQWVKDAAAPAMNPARHILRLSEQGSAGQEFLNAFNEFKQEEFVIKYHQHLLTQALSEAMQRQDFYNDKAFASISPGNEAKQLIEKGADHLAAAELYRLNELLFVAAFPGLTLPIDDWGGIPGSMIDDMKAAGIRQAWIGFNDWLPGQMHPAFVAKVSSAGYLAGPYDSYHSMHEPGKEKWETAKFDDTSLYTTAFVLNKNGRPAGGFLGVGRKLNPTLSMPVVKHRMEKIMSSPNQFNSWFIDCDATGEVYDDYTPGRMTSKKQDIEARLQRMAWIRDRYQLVIGSETGNDFAAGTIAFGHGMTTPVIAWSDPDMRSNKKSPYYVGSYFSNNGGIPERYSLPVPLKDKYAYLYYDNRFNVPLFQLVYNNSVITSHHWEWGSLKVPAQVSNTSLKEILYNVPPLYHLDQANWEKYKPVISKHVRVFSITHARAVKLEMTAFDWLTKDRLVQRTQFGHELEIIANFGTAPFAYQEKIVPAKALVIHDLLSGTYDVYQP